MQCICESFYCVLGCAVDRPIGIRHSTRNRSQLNDMPSVVPLLEVFYEELSEVNESCDVGLDHGIDWVDVCVVC